MDWFVTDELLQSTTVTTWYWSIAVCRTPAATDRHSINTTIKTTTVWEWVTEVGALHGAP